MGFARRLALATLTVGTASARAHGAAGEVNVQSVGSIAGLRTFARHEWCVETGQTYPNPFDPTVVAVDASFIAPNGRVTTLPAFWDVRPDASAGAFFVRFTAPTAGHWSMGVNVTDSTGKRTSPSTAFDVSAGTGAGFVRVADNHRYLRFDSGDSYFPVGLNLCWPEGNPDSGWYYSHFKTLADNGVNFARLWMCHPPVMLESDRSTLGRYDLEHAAYFDRVLDSAEQNGIRVMLCFVNHPEFLDRDMWGKGGWDSNPYNAALGGPATRPTDFFSSDVAIKHLQARLRYIVARYAAYTSIGFWELFNEQENDRVPITVPWNAAMASYLKSIDPYQHLVTTSASMPPGVWKLPAMDVTQTHIYGDGTQVDLVTPVAAALRVNQVYGKPHLVGEIGWSYKGPDGPVDPHQLGTTLHNSLWAGLASGNLGTGMYWWWDNYIFPDGLYTVFKPAAAFGKNIDWAHSNYQPVAVENLYHTDAPSDTYTDLTIPASGGWGDRNQGPIRVDADGHPSATPAMYLTGPGHGDTHEPAVFDLTLPAGCTLKFGISKVSDLAIVRVSVDGNPVRDFPFSALPGAEGVTHSRIGTTAGIFVADVNKEFSVPVPAGKHRVQIELVVGDWVTLSHVTFTKALPLKFANLSVMALQDANTKSVIAWLLDTRSNWKQDLTGASPPAAADVTFTLPNMADGPYRASWFDTRRGETIQTDAAIARGGKLLLRAPSFERDVAVRVVPSD